MRRRAGRQLLIALAAAATAAAPCAAQVDARFDAAIAYVKYDGYIGSGAASLSSAVAWRSVGTTLGARGTAVVFESGNTSLQGSLSVGTFSPAVGPLRFEGAAEAGGSAYSGYSEVARFAHALGNLRLHLVESRWGVWAGGLAGAVETPGADGGASGVSAGAWLQMSAGALDLSWGRQTSRGATWSDLQGRARWLVGPVTLEALAGSRSSAAVASGAYGDFSASLRLSDRLAVIFAAGSYLSDPMRGTIPGRYATVGLRLGTRTSAAREMPHVPGAPSPQPSPTSPWLEGARVSIELLDGQPMLVVYAAAAHEVEVTGDFTGWQPAAMAADGEGRYRYALPLAAGVQRFSIRLDGGPWGVPEGAALEADEFGGSVGVLVVP